jgi:hypothetical protein
MKTPLKNQKNRKDQPPLSIVSQADLLQFDPDFITLKRFDFSVKKLQERYPEGCPDHISAQALGLTPEEFQKKYQEIIENIKDEMGVE